MSICYVVFLNFKAVSNKTALLVHFGKQNPQHIVSVVTDICANQCWK